LSNSHSESPDQREIVMLSGESRSGNVRKILPIIRTKDGRFRRFGPCGEVPTDLVAGRFAQLLPVRPPTRAEQDRASLLLASVGIAVPGLNLQPSAN
jgi:hypothetical protein